MVNKKRFSLKSNLIWYGTFFIIILALIDTMIYRLPDSLAGGYWFNLAIFISFGAILHFLRSLNDYEQWTITDLFKKK